MTDQQEAYLALGKAVVAATDGFINTKGEWKRYSLRFLIKTDGDNVELTDFGIFECMPDPLPTTYEGLMRKVNKR